MISKYEMIKYLDEHPALGITYDKKSNSVLNTKTNKTISDFDTFIETYRKMSGESFRIIHSCPGTLKETLECTECRTIIFSSTDYLDYDPRLKCPVCANYDTHFDYWTRQEILKDPAKQGYIVFLNEMTEEYHKRDMQVKARNGKQSWEITKHQIKTKKYHIQFGLQCDDINRSRFRGLKYRIDIFKRDDEEDCFIFHKSKLIPLSISAFKIWRQIKQQRKDYENEKLS